MSNRTVLLSPSASLLESCSVQADDGIDSDVPLINDP
jgi:hypothetical protein